MWSFFRIGNVRAGKVSIEAMLQACLHKTTKCERAHDRATVSRGVGQVRSTACTKSLGKEKEDIV